MASAPSISEQNIQDEDDRPADPTYLAHFSEHLNHVHSHITGRDEHGALPPSFFPPRAFWTSAEKEAFFHGLAIHSRLRPDLIAEDIKTKTMVDVCVYLHALEEGARATPVHYRKDMPIAMEVSDRWVVLEEGKALALEKEEPEREQKALQDKRDEEVASRKLALRARKRRARTGSHERDRDGEKDRRESLRSWLSEKKEDWKVEDALRALDLPTLKAMDRMLRQRDEARSADELQEVEKMQRAAYAAAEAVQLAHGEQGSFEAQEHSPVGEEVIDPALRTESRGGQSMPAVPDLSPIASSAQPPHMLPHPHFQPSTPPFQSVDLPSQVLNPSTPPVVCKTLPDEGTQPDDTQLSPAARRKLQKRMHMRKKRAEAKGGVVNPTTDKLKPGKRRTGRSVSLQESHQSPLQTQEKKTAINGTQDSSYSVRKNAQPDVGYSQDVQNTDENHEKHDAGDQPSETEDDEPKRRSRASGITLPYRLVSKLQSKGLDADKLHEESLGLLHLGGLAKLMRLYNKLHDVPVSVGTQISAEVIRLLHEHVVNFTTQVMHRTIISREQERLAKMNTKAWRLGGKQIINATNVNHALAMMGSQNFSKSAHFGGLLERLGFEAQDVSEVDESDAPEDEEGHERHPKRSRHTKPAVRPRARSSSLRSEDEDEDEDIGADYEDDDTSEDDADVADEESLVSSSRSLHRTIFAPFIRLPSDLNSGSLSGGSNPLDVSSYMPWRPSSAPAELVADGDPMEEETDVEALLEELLEDEKLDKRDHAIEEIYEKGLWAKFSASRSTHTGEEESASIRRAGRKRKRDELGSDEDDAGDEALTDQLLRFHEPDRFGPVKSQIYVVDSD